MKLVDGNEERKEMSDIGEIEGRIVGFDEDELREGWRWKRIDMKIKLRMEERIESKSKRMEEINEIKLSLIEIGNDKFEGRKERKKMCEWGEILEKKKKELEKIEINWRKDISVMEVDNGKRKRRIWIVKVGIEKLKREDDGEKIIIRKGKWRLGMIERRMRMKNIEMWSIGRDLCSKKERKKGIEKKSIGFWKLKRRIWKRYMGL